MRFQTFNCVVSERYIGVHPLRNLVIAMNDMIEERMLAADLGADNILKLGRLLVVAHRPV